MAHVFLSYSRKDLEFMRRLRDDLLKEGLGVWTDDIGLEPGTPNWENAIANALNQAGCMVVVLSPDAAQSKWVGIEVAFADERGVRIFPLLARGDPRDAVPFRLTTCQRIDARGDYQRALQQLIPAVCEHLAIESISEKPSVSTEVGHLSHQHQDEVQRREEVASHAFLEAEAPTPQAEQGRVTYEEAVESALREADARRRSQAGFEARRREAGAPTPQQAEEGRARHREAVESALREADTRRRRQAEDKARRREEKARPAIREAEAPAPQPEQGRTKYQEAVKAALHEADKKRANRSH